MFLLLILPAALVLADTHRVLADGQVDFSVFKTFVVRQGYPTSRQPGSGNQGTKRTPDVDPKLTQAVQYVLRSAFVAGIVVIDFTNAATDTIVWHGQYIDDEETSAKIEKHLPENVKKLLSEYPPKKK
jgi:hypothetical protein